MDKADITDAGPRLKAMSDSLTGFDQMRAIIDSLRSEVREQRREIAALREERLCPYVTGTVTKYCTLTPLRLTDAEKQAVKAVLADPDLVLGDAREPLRGLLERTRATGSE